jgi:hypothetical protein
MSFIGTKNLEGKEKGTYICYSYQVVLSSLHILSELFDLIVILIKKETQTQSALEICSRWHVTEPVT